MRRLLREPILWVVAVLVTCCVALSAWANAPAEHEHLRLKTMSVEELSVVQSGSHFRLDVLGTRDGVYLRYRRPGRQLLVISVQDIADAIEQASKCECDCGRKACDCDKGRCCPDRKDACPMKDLTCCGCYLGKPCKCDPATCKCPGCKVHKQVSPTPPGKTLPVPQK